MASSMPQDYLERVYAGVLGKMIGVYLGRPFEGWPYERIIRELGQVDYYVNDRLPDRPPLVITDDDICGTFTLLRALPDHDYNPAITARQIGQTWLNYVIEQRSMLWWGGFGFSTEHTAYLRLKNGIPAPQSGSAALNGKIISEQIGAQIFIDGWAMVAPGDPELAASLAARAASVSHDGEAIYGAQMIAAMEALAFVEPDISRLIAGGLAQIPAGSIVYRLVNDILEWHELDDDWRKTRARIAARYGYDSYGGNCHIVPNHALIVLGLLYSGDDFQQAMKVVSTAGWDTDCNAGNLGCLMGIKNGLGGLDAGPDWRGPLADRLYLPSADGGRAITDAVIESVHVANAGRALRDLPPLAPKKGARFHFELPGSVQGFHTLDESVTLRNVSGHSNDGHRALALQFSAAGRAATPTFIQPQEVEMGWYPLIASPTLFSGQVVRAGLSAERDAVANLFIQVYDAGDRLMFIESPAISLAAGVYEEFSWRVPDTAGRPIAGIGLAYRGEGDAVIYMDYITWSGTPELTLTVPAGDSDDGPDTMWRRAWVDGIDLWQKTWPEPFRLVQNEGRGLLMQGTREWTDYEVQATITPTLMSAGGIALRVQGMRRYYALLLCDDGMARLIKAFDGDVVLGTAAHRWREEESYELRLQAQGALLRAWIDGELLFEVEDDALDGGAAAFVLQEGHMVSHSMTIKAITL
ncbi:MAG: ADP-ribosylglycohydrolase family protein [Candidatus Promineifilaceae bacterium]